MDVEGYKHCAPPEHLARRVIKQPLLCKAVSNDSSNYCVDKIHCP